MSYAVRDSTFRECLDDQRNGKLSDGVPNARCFQTRGGNEAQVATAQWSELQTLWDLSKIETVSGARNTKHAHREHLTLLRQRCYGAALNEQLGGYGNIVTAKFSYPSEFGSSAAHARIDSLKIGSRGC